MSASCSTHEDTAWILPPPVTENTHAPCVEMSFIWPPTAPEIEIVSCLYKIVTPYKLLAWGISLCGSGLLYSFPNLVFDITNGDPIGNPSPLTYTFNLENLNS